MHLKLDPSQLLTIWPVIIAVLSLLNKFALSPFAPNVARFISAVISIPTGHLANFIEDIQQLIKDVTAPPPPAGPNGSGGSPGNGPKPPPPAALRVGLAGAALIGLNASCAPAQQAVEAKVEQVILDDLAAGKTLPQIEADVAQLVAGQPGADAAIIVNDVLAFLIDIGVIPPGILPQARMMLAEVAPEATLHRATR